MLSLISPRGQDGSPKSSAGASQGRTEDDGHMKVVGAIRHWTLRIGWIQQGCRSWLDIAQKSQIIWDSLEKSKTFQTIWSNKDKHYVTRLSWAKEYQLPRLIWAPFPSGGCPAQTTTEDGRGGYVSPSTGSTMICQRVSGIFWGWITRAGHPGTTLIGRASIRKWLYELYDVICKVFSMPKFPWFRSFSVNDGY